MMTKEDYFAFYEKYGRCVDDIGKRNHALNERQLNSKYEKYVRKQESKNKPIEIDEKWNELKQQLPNECSLINALKAAHRYTDIHALHGNARFLVTVIDGAHVFSRQKAPWMKYDIDNVVPLNRYSHSMLDFMRDPITGATITKEEQEDWWKFILGNERWNRLNDKFNRGGQDV